MATRSLNVQITGDARPLSVATDKAGRHIGDLEKRGAKMGKALAVGFAAAGAAAAGALVVGLKKSVDAAVEAEKSQAKLKAQLAAMDRSYRAHAKEIEAVIQKHSRLAGVDDEDLQDAFTGILRTTGSVKTAMKDLGLVTDIMRAKHIDASKAGAMLSKVHAGNVTALNKMGIAVEPVTAAQDRLKASTEKATDEQIKAAKAADKAATGQKGIAELQKRFGGQAEAYGKTAAGAQDRFAVALENVQEKLGAKLLPVLGSVANAVAKFLDGMDRGIGVGGRFAEIARGIGSTIANVASVIGAFAQRVRDTFSGGDDSATGSFNKFASNAREAIRLVVGAVTEIGQKVSAVFSEGGIGANLAIIGRAFLKLESVVSTVVLFIAKHTIPIIVGVIEGLATTIKGVVQVIAGILSGDFGKAWDGVKTIVRGAVKAIVAIVRGLGDLLWDGAKLAGETVGKGILKGLASLGHLLWEKVKDAFSFLTDPQRVAATAETVGDAIGKGILNGLGDLGHLLLDKAKAALSFVADNLPGPAGALGKVIKSATGDGIGKTLGSPLPSGTFGGNLMGARPSMAPFAAAASRFGLGVSSGRRPGAITSSGNVSYHSSGEAIDVSGNPAGMLGFFRQMKARYGSKLAELIYTPGGAGVKNGRAYSYGGKVAADHYDHVHVAYDSGVPGVGDGPGRIFNWAKSHGFTDNQAAGWVGNIAQESNFRSDAKQPNGPGRGLAQWGGSRFTALQSFAANRKKPWTDYQTQLDFMWSELQGPESAAYTAIKGAKSLEAATSAIATRYERADVIGDRLGPAKAALARFGKGGPGGSGGKAPKKNQTASGGGIGAYDPAATYDTENAAAENLPDPFTGRMTGAAGFAQRISSGTAGRPLKGGGPTKGISAAEGEARAAAAAAAGNVPSLEDFALARVARARLTAGTEDDLGALGNLLQLRQAQMDAALSDSDPRNDADAIEAFLSVKESIDQLTQSTDTQNALLQQQLDVVKEERDAYKRSYSVSQSQYGILADALSEVVNGGIGQRLGLSLSGMRAAPGAVARA